MCFIEGIPDPDSTSTLHQQQPIHRHIPARCQEGPVEKTRRQGNASVSVFKHFLLNSVYHFH